MAEALVMLVNPQRDDLAARLVELVGADLERLAPERPDDIPQSVAGAVDRGAAVVAAVGGDGTQRSVAAALVGTSTRLGVIPGGTVNLLAKVLGLDEIVAAAAALTSGQRRSIDVGACNGEIFLLNASSGYDAAVIERADGVLKRRMGRFGFAIAALDRLRGLKSIGVRVEVDGQLGYEGRASTVIVTNVAQRSSAEVLLAPDASIDDGLLHVVIVRGASIASLVRVVRAVVGRREPHRDDARRLTGTMVRVAWVHPVAGQVDGDPIPADRQFEHTVSAGAVDVCR